MTSFSNAMAGMTFAASLLVGPALAGAPLEGTWGGADARGRTAQVTIVGNQVIGVFWLDDYHDADNPRFSAGGSRLDFVVQGRKARLERAGAGARITVDEPGGSIAIQLKKD